MLRFFWHSVPGQSEATGGLRQKTICIWVNGILIVSGVTQSHHCADVAVLSAQVCGTERSRSLRGQQVIRMHAPAKAKHATTHLEWEQMGPKPGLWSWHLIPTSCRLSEQLQGRTLQLSCNDQFDTRQHTQQSQILKWYREGTFLGTWIYD